MRSPVLCRGRHIAERSNAFSKPAEHFYLLNVAATKDGGRDHSRMVRTLAIYDCAWSCRREPEANQKAFPLARSALSTAVLSSVPALRLATSVSQSLGVDPNQWRPTISGLVTPDPPRVSNARSFCLCRCKVTLVPSILWARSDEIPTPDVRPVCRGIASQSADPGVGQKSQADTYRQCMESEQAVRKQLKREWSAFSAADKRHRVTLATTGGELSNTELFTCLEMARDVRVLRSAASGAEMTKPASSPSVPTVQPAIAVPIPERMSRKRKIVKRKVKSNAQTLKFKRRRHLKCRPSASSPMQKRP